MPIVFNNPFPTLETPDLVLRQITSSDLQAYNAIYSDVEVMRTWGTTPHKSPADTEQLIQTLAKGYELGTSIRWGLELKSSGEFIGDTGFWRLVRERNRAEVGAKLAKAHWSGGLMTQALGRIVQHGFEEMGLNTVEANIEETNPGAIRMIEKLGFVREGILKEHSYCAWREKYVDTILFTAHKSRWKPVSTLRGQL